MVTNTITKTVKFPIMARMVRQPDGRYQVSDAVYAEIPFESIVRLFWQAYRADQEKAVS